MVTLGDFNLFFRGTSLKTSSENFFERPVQSNMGLRNVETDHIYYKHDSETNQTSLGRFIVTTAKRPGTHPKNPRFCRDWPLLWGK